MKWNILAAVAALPIVAIGWNSPAVAITCPAGSHSIVERNGSQVCVGNTVPAPPAPYASCENLTAVDRARLDALGDEQIASNFLAIAKRDEDNASAAGHYDAAGRVDKWQTAYDTAHGKYTALTVQENAIVAAMNKAGLHPTACVGLPHLPPH